MNTQRNEIIAECETPETPVLNPNAKMLVLLGVCPLLPLVGLAWLLSLTCDANPAST